MKLKVLALSILLASNTVYAEDFNVFEHVGTFTGYDDDTLSFYISDHDTYGKGASIHANDKYKINSVTFIPGVTSLINIYGYIKEQILWLDPNASIGAFSQSDVDSALNSGKQICIDNPAACGIEIPVTTLTQADVDAALNSGKQICIDNPAACGIEIPVTTLTQADVDAALSSGKQICIDDPAACGINIPTTTQASKPIPSLTHLLSFHINEMNMVTNEGIQKIWADFQWVPHQQKILFEVVEFGIVTQSDLDSDGFTIEEGDCNDSNANINPESIEIEGDNIDQDCQIDLTD